MPNPALPCQLATGKLPLIPDKQLVVTPTHSSSYQQLVARVSKAGTAISEFPRLRTQSGNSLGSVEHYNMDWNAADTSEVSSHDPVAWQSVGPSHTAQSIHALQVAVLNASKVTEVHLPRLNAFFFYNK